MGFMILTYNIQPVSKGRPRFTRKGFTYTPKETKDFKNNIVMMTKAQLHTDFKMFTHAISVSITFYIKRPKSVKRKYPTVKPDIDNLEKAMYDALNGLVYKDDCLIVMNNNMKLYEDSAHKPGITVCVQDVETLGLVS